MNKYLTIMVQCATLGPIGKLSASGTWATLLALPVAAICAHLWWYHVFVLLNFCIAKLIIDQALVNFQDNDPCEIVLDEWVGCLVVFLFVPITFKSLCLGFIAFRFWDITKWCGVNQFEKIPGALGIIADDFYAGMLAGVTVWIWLLISKI